MRIKDIVLIGMMSAILVTVQVTLAFLPNVELVSLLIILYALIFGKRTVYIIYVFVLLQGLLYGFTHWWINYLYVWTILFFIAMLLRKIRTPFIWAIVSGFYGLAFGALCSIPYFIIGGLPTGFAYWINGIPFDIIHGISNFGIALVLFYPLFFILNYINHRMELSQ